MQYGLSFLSGSHRPSKMWSAWNYQPISQYWTCSERRCKPTFQEMATNEQRSTASPVWVSPSKDERKMKAPRDTGTTGGRFAFNQLCSRDHLSNLSFRYKCWLIRYVLEHCFLYQLRSKRYNTQHADPDWLFPEFHAGLIHPLAG